MNRAAFEWLWEQARWEMDGGVNGHFHALQTAARAEQAGASDQLVFAALVHDLGKPLAADGHGAAIASAFPTLGGSTRELLADHAIWVAYVRSGRYLPGGRPGSAGPQSTRRAERLRFAEWDAASFELGGPIHSLDHFAPLVDRYVR